jgi:DNA ligase-1
MTRPMLAARVEDLSLLRFPLLVTPKLDGIRCLKLGGKLLSRSFKPIRNAFVNEQLADLPDGTDGELVIPNCEFNGVTSGIMSADGQPDFRYAVFDVIADAPYSERVKHIPSHPRVMAVEPELVDDLLQFQLREEAYLSHGHEGIMARAPSSPYKFGRSTLKEGYLLKRKPLEDSEAVIIGFEEGQHNANPQVPNAFGYMKRPGGAAGKVLADTLGSFLVKDVSSGVEFSIGTGVGLTLQLRREIWLNRAAYLGRLVTYSYQRCGTVDKPRFPRFKGFRDVEDM